ncbi:hypothetical protein BDV26DRAFT_296702 [Aspergillus bertholletiae]|uniref:Uncharacterized protein n=1 Tax=Aspergillus bertholletiae TaxID=1226010 RepID=A0A5N7AV42_9EURO|nr:hypothetical protein BDV26DRAFT_296702 [Aspergillus bertholletiae]
MSHRLPLFAISAKNTTRSAMQKGQMMDFLEDKLMRIVRGPPSSTYTQVKLRDGTLECPACGHLTEPEPDSRTTKYKYAPIQYLFFGIFIAGLVALAGAFYYIGRQSVLNKIRESRVKSDIIFPNIPLKEVKWINDERFMSTDPYKGRFWGNKEGEWTVWDEVHRGSWIQLSPSPADDVTGGLPLDLYSANGSWPNGKEGYVPSVLHQLHCVGAMNHIKLVLQEGGTIDDKELKHMAHCVEYLRHAVMCYGDTALEKPADHSNFVRAETEWTTHVCRDWTALSQHFWASSIDFIWGTDAPLTVFENVDALKGPVED